MSESRDLRGWRFFFRAFQYRNYRLFFGGQSISLIGTWMQIIAVGWLVYRLTHSPVMLGIAGFCNQFPTFILAPFAGVLADKWNRHRILVITQTSAMLQALILAVLVLTGTVTVWSIIILGVILAMVNAFDAPTRQAFVVEMVEDKKDLGNAIALNSAMFNGARLLGPSIAGVLIAAVGEGLCFLLNSLSFIAVIAALLAMTLKPKPRERVSQGVIKEIKLGFDYVAGSVPIRSILLLLALVSLVGMPYTVLMPVIAREIFHGGPRTLGLLMATIGIGALIGAAFLAARKDARGLEKILPMAVSIFGFGLVIFSFSRAIHLSLVLLVITGFGMMVSMAASNTLLQTVVDDDKRGRVMSFFAMSFLGMAPLGSLLGGWSTKLIGAPKTLLIGGIVCIVAAFFFAQQMMLLGEIIRSLGKKLGITPLQKFTGPPE